MPSVPSRNRFLNRTVGDCARDGMVLVVRCGGCRRTVTYWAEDLVQVLGPRHQAHVPPWNCGRCRSREFMAMRWSLPGAEEMAQGLTVRRPVRKIVKWIWRDEKL